jgi:hypothetical protein
MFSLAFFATGVITLCTAGIWFRLGRLERDPIAYCVAAVIGLFAVALLGLSYTIA